MAKKLSQQEILDNWDAINSFLANAEIEVENSDMKLFKARCEYKHLNDGSVTKCRKSRMSYGTNAFGGMTLSVPVLQDKPGCFTIFCADYCHFRLCGGSLVVSGKDDYNTGKGDYEMTIG